MVVKIYKLEDLIEEMNNNMRGIDIVRVQGTQKKVPITYGNAKAHIQIMHIAFEIVVTAKFKGEIFEYVEKIGLISENEDKRRIKTLQNKAVRAEKDITEHLDREGFNIGKGIYNEDS